MATASMVNYPAPGCVVEFLESNAVQIALVLEESGGKLRLLLPSRRETRLAQNRILPWAGPAYPAGMGREEAVRVLERHKLARELKATEINPLEAWEMAQGEISQAPASWFAELCENDPDIDVISAYGRALLAAKTHFRFQHPNFQVYDAEHVEKRLEEQRAKAEKEALVTGGANFLRYLWDIASKKKPPLDLEDQSSLEILPDEKISERIQRLLLDRMLSPESVEDDPLWVMLSKGLPTVPHLALQLLIAWGKLPPHYNFWLDRAGYDPGDAWWHEFSDEVDRLEALGRSGEPQDDFIDLPFISIDSAKTRDIDDAFYIERKAGGWTLTVALACPSLGWDFSSAFDRKILHRGTSIYLPEGDMHMLPEKLGTHAYSLLEGEQRPAFCLQMDVDESGSLRGCAPFRAHVRLAANLAYPDVQELLDDPAKSQNRASAFAGQLIEANALAARREKKRICDGAVILRRPEQHIQLEGSGQDITVNIEAEEPAPDAQRLVSEMMVLASSALAEWAAERNIPLLHRTQNLTLPREYAGIWSRPEDLAKIMHSMVPSILEVEPRPHAALAVPRYAPVTSPLRRYADLVNEEQTLHYIKNSAPRWNKEELEGILGTLSPALDAAGQVQKLRPRYWKLLYFRQSGEQKWWSGVITEENENFVNVSLPEMGISVRGKRLLFDERACPGQHFRARIGKVNPLYNEINILEAIPAE